MSHKKKFYGKYNNSAKNMNQENAKPQDLNESDIEEVTPEEIIPEDVEAKEASPEEDSSINENAQAQDLHEEVSEVCDDAQKKIDELQAELDKQKKEYLFLMAEFDNFRKRTLKEKSEIIKNAGENVLKGLLPIMDDFERGIKAAENSPEADSVKEGVNLIYNKFKKYLNQNGVKEFDPNDDNFDTEKHEAISVVPVPDEDKKGKILDTVEKGYTINDKVLRHAKVVVGQ